MNKSDKAIVAVLVCLLFAWAYYGRKFAPQVSPPPAPSEQSEMATTGTVAVAADAAASEARNVAVPGAASVEPEEEVVHTSPEDIVELTNSVLSLSFSSWGGGITAAALNQYPATMEEDSGPEVLDFSRQPALSVVGLPGIAKAADVEIERLSNVNAVRVTFPGESGLTLSRTVLLTNGYQVAVNDVFINSSGETIDLPDIRIQAGPMHAIVSKAKTRGISYLGVDTLSTEDGRVIPWGKKLSKMFGGGGCSKPNLQGAPLSQTEHVEQPLAWVGVKNKYFAQVLEPDDLAEGCDIRVFRTDSDTQFDIDYVVAEMELAPLTLAAGERVERNLRYYVGPKKFSELRALGNKQDHMLLRSWKGWGWWRWACIWLLGLLNILKLVTFNYGIAIILLTIIVKVVFWPLTHKGTENMKKMQKLQPELTKLREKYKNDPKKLQEKQMLFYREQGVNPLAGCLPMFVQMPIFIALFTVLRGAVELRFAPFLWIADLSEPEGLLAGVLPFPQGGLNILPLAMTGTMILQQRLTPSAGDPQQQKMMQFMPVMMLFIFYSMPSALVLYWTVSQLLSVLQLVLQQRKDKK